MLGADYSTARPGGAVLAAAGVTGVGRYLGTDSRCLTAPEYQDLTSHGVGVWTVVEEQNSTLTVSMLQGYAKGVQDALLAEAQIAAVGLPANTMVHWAADFDIAPGSTRIAAADAYVDGFNTIIPQGRRGGYGGLWYLKHVHDLGKVDHLWECASTGFRHGVDPSQVPIGIQQTTQTPPVPGTDHNIIYSTAAFAGSGGFLMALTDAEQAELLTDVRALIGFLYAGGPSVDDASTYKPNTVMQRLLSLGQAVFDGGPSMPDGHKSIGQSLADLRSLAVTPDQISAALLPSVQSAVSSLSLNVDPNVLASALAPTLANALATALAQHLNISLEAK